MRNVQYPGAVVLSFTCAVCLGCSGRAEGADGAADGLMDPAAAPVADGAEPDLSSPDEDDEEDPFWPPIRDDAVAVWPWWRQAPHAVNGTYLPAYFTDNGYTPPAGSEIVVARVVAGVGQPAYQFYDVGGSAFSFDFWPASAVKVLAPLGALDFMGTRGLSGDAVVTIYFSDGTTLTKAVRDIYDAAVRISSNSDYDHCVEIAGFDRFNEVFLSPDRDLPLTVIQRRYGYHGSLRTSPPMDFVEGSRTVSIAERTGTGDFGCPPDGNCTNLFELINALRRVTLHDEIPAVEKFNLKPQDAAGLQGALLGSESYFQAGAAAVFGGGVLIYNKTGFVPDNDILDHGMVVDPSTGDRYLVAVAVPEATSSTGELSDLVQEALFAVYVADSTAAMPWQRDAGASIRVQLDDGGIEGGRRRIIFTIDAAGADRVRLWTDTWPLGETTGGPRFTFTYDYQGGGERLLVLQAYSGGVAVGYRAMAVFIPPP